MELRGWLPSQGQLLEVLDPESPREDLRSSIEAMARNYGVETLPQRQ